MSETIELTGTVEDLFGHRFTLTTQDGKALVDLGPDAGEDAQVRPGQQVAIEGEKKPSEIKAKRIRVAQGEWQDVATPGKPASSHGDTTRDGRDGDARGSAADHLIDDDHVTAVLNAAGYTDHGERVRKPKHVEVTATRDGQRHVVHVHKDGVKKAEPVG